VANPDQVDSDGDGKVMPVTQWLMLVQIRLLRGVVLVEPLSVRWCGFYRPCRKTTYL